MPKLTPEQRANAIQKLHDIITGDDNIPRLNTRASRAYLAAVDRDKDTSDLRAFAEVCRVAAALADQLAIREGDCELVHRPSILAGRTRVAAHCTTCDVPLSAWTIEEVQANFARHQAIPAPPAEILDRPITKSDTRAYSDYFISGRGRAVASTTMCPHMYYLTDSCPGCDADQEAAEEANA